jgi:hypothetical protein
MLLAYRTEERKMVNAIIVILGSNQNIVLDEGDIVPVRVVVSGDTATSVKRLNRIEDKGVGTPGSSAFS